MHLTTRGALYLMHNANAVTPDLPQSCWGYKHKTQDCASTRPYPATVTVKLQGLHSYTATVQKARVCTKKQTHCRQKQAKAAPQAVGNYSCSYQQTRSQSGQNPLTTKNA